MVYIFSRQQNNNNSIDLQEKNVTNLKYKSIYFTLTSPGSSAEFSVPFSPLIFQEEKQCMYSKR